MSWVTHTTAHFADEKAPMEEDGNESIEVTAVKARIGTGYKNSFSIDYLDGVGVSAMVFPWAVTEHFGNDKEMIAGVDMAPDVAAGSSLPWDPQSWAPMFDAATSIGSTLFFKEPRLRMPAQIDRVTLHRGIAPPKIGYIYVREAPGTALAVDVDITNEDGECLAIIQAMRFAEIEGTLGVSGTVESLVHQLSWPPVGLVEHPLSLGQAIAVSKAIDAAERYEKSLESEATSISRCSSVQELSDNSIPSTNDNRTAVIIYIPEPVESFGHVSKAAGTYCTQLLGIVKYVTGLSVPVKIYAITESVWKGESPTALAQALLHGLGRIIASE